MIKSTVKKLSHSSGLLRIISILVIGVFSVLLLNGLFANATSYRGLIQAEPTLLNYWPMDESAGASTLTALAGGVNLNLTGGTAGSTGQVDGTAVSFNGTTDYAKSASNINLSSQNKVVVEAVVNFPAGDGNTRVAWEQTTSTIANQGGFFFASNEPSLTPRKYTAFLNGNSGFNYGFFNQASANAWHHVAVEYDMSASTNEVNIYIDGSLQSAFSRPSNNNNTSNFANAIFHVMGRNGNTFPAQGKMQHLAIYSSLNSTAIAAHAAAALAGNFSAGTLAETTHTTTSATLNWTSATGANGAVSTQLQRSAEGANSWSDVVGATSSPATDTGLSPSTGYDYRVAYTDTTPATVYSNTINIDTDSLPSTTYTVQQADLWDNGYDNVSAPRQSPFARFVFTTDAASVTVNGTTNIYNSYSQWAHLGVRIDGVDASPLVFSSNGTQNFTVNLGSEGTTRTVEIIAGLQSAPSGTPIGSFINSVNHLNSNSFTVVPPTVGERVVFYGDSISVGANATNPEYQGIVALLRSTYNYRVLNEGWGFRSLYDDANGGVAQTAFVNRIASYTPSTIWMAIGTNDYGLNRWSAASFGTAYAAVLDGLHAQLPSARIICQTPLPRTTETANGSGSTLSDYRSQITSVCNARAWTTLVSGTTILTTADLNDGVHPSVAGHTKYAKRVAPVLANPAFTVSGPNSGLIGEESTAFTVSLNGNNLVFMGDQSITISAADGTISATAGGGSISNNNSSSVTVTPANAATEFTFTYTPNSTPGSKTLTFTNAQSWINADDYSYTANGLNSAPDTPASLGGASFVSGGWSNDSTPTFSFTINDDDVEDTVAYTIQVDDDADFNSPVIDYTSAQAAQGSFNFTVGQLAGTGTYSSGSSGMSLSDSSYYWRVKAFDAELSESAYAVANSGSIAFKIDTATPTTPGTPSTTTPTNDTTPSWTWSESSDSGSGVDHYIVAWTQDPTFSSGISSDTVSDTTFTHTTPLSNGTWYFAVAATDGANNNSNFQNDSVTIDTESPTLTETTPVSTPTNDTTPSYSFNSDETGTIQYGGSCSSLHTSAVSGSNQITFSTLSPGTYSDCTITVTDGASNISNTLAVTSFVIDTSSPGATLSPLDNETDVSPITDFSILFTEAVNVGDGTIVIKKSSDNTVIETINSTSGQVSGSGTNTITINPTTTLQDATEYYILISNTAFRDLAGNYFAGISSTTAWSFVTSDTNPPIISSISSSNADGVYGAGSTIVVVLNFSESVTSTGDVMVTLETGSADRSCTFSLSHSNTGSCEYVVQSGDVSSDLSVISVSGTIRDQFNNQMSNFTAQTNLESLKNIVIDTEAPTTPGKPTNLSLSSDATPTWSWGLSSDSSAITYIVEWSIDSSFNANVFSTTTDASEFTHSSSLTAQTWYFRVKASDAAGNVSGYSEIGETSIAALSDQSSLKRSNSEFGSRDSESLPSEPRILLNDFTEFTSGSGYPIKVKVDDTYAFKVEDEEHVMIIKEIGSDYVDFEIHSEMQSFRLNISETGRFDVNNDGVNDISILVKNISNETAEIIVAQILPSSTTKQKSTTLTSDSGDAKSSTSSSSKIILVIVVLVIIITLYLFAKKRNLSKKQ